MARKSGESSVRPSIMERVAPILVVLSIGLAFMTGVLWQKVSNLEKGGGGGTTTAGTQQAPAQEVDLDTIKGLFDKDLIKFGDANRKVLFVEVLDPSCPYCHVAGGHDPELAARIDTQTNRFKYVSDGGDYKPPVPEMKKLVDEGKASIAFIYFPGHANGEMGMKALYCAHDQGKFWEAHDLLMSEAGYTLMNEKVLNDASKSQDVADFLKGTVDTASLKSCLDSGKYDARLGEEESLAASLSTTGTPGFFINAGRYPGAYSWDDIVSAVEKAL
ncbi:MAG TPA: DsbA family protein [Patescibacteria group bacterium]|nr:DsbA family protein [Patescibacteria group bacterium]